jgi:uncharacterized surface anchored protein
MRYLLVALAACGAGSHDTRPRPTLGLITGLTRDKSSGDTLEGAAIQVGTHAVESDKVGLYQVEGLAPGTYTLVARFADQPVTVTNIDVSAGQATYVDISFALGEVGPISYDYRNARETEIERFTTLIPRIEGTVSDSATRARVAGAVVTAAGNETLQTVTDDNGRYRFDQLQPGTYAISAYYSIGGRAQIEVRRSDITVGAREGVLVPLYIEISRQ